jgi:RNA recognition motif-containing protein
MVKTLYVGNLPWNLTDTDLARAISEHVSVQSARIILDRETGRSRGFGFVEVNEADAEQAISLLNGTIVGGRPLIVNEAQPRQARSRQE